MSAAASLKELVANHPRVTAYWSALARVHARRGAVDEAREAGIEEFIFVTSRGKSALEDYFDS